MPSNRFQLVENIVLEVIELEKSKREQFLRDRCQGDDALRQEVESFLAFQDEAVSFIEEPAIESAAVFFRDEHSLDDIEGQRVGSYTLMRRLGEGGMGAVYLAERAAEYEQSVAIKIVRSGLLGPDVLARFRNERQILASLDHLHIAKLLDGGTTEDGTPYLVMDYVVGAPIDRYCDEHKLSTHERLRLFLDVCSAIAYAHRNLVIHRDIKPSNILVTDDGVTKLLDFGIAKVLTVDPTDSEHTATNWRIMTPQYASPEQIRGRQITTSSDIYSLGVLLYKLLSGHLPYDLKTLPPSEVERIVCEKDPVRPSTAIERVEPVTSDGPAATAEMTADSVAAARSEQPDGLRRQLRGDLDNIVLMAMRKEPERRYSSVEQFAEDIERHLKGLPVVARPDTLRYRSEKFFGRHKFGVIAAGVVSMALLAALVVTAWQARLAKHERDQAQQEKLKTEQINKFLQTILTAASPEQFGKEAKVLAVLDDAAANVDTEFSQQPELRLRILMTIGTTYFQVGDMNKAEKVIREALALKATLNSQDDHDTSMALVALGGALMNKGSFKEAEECLVQAANIERRLDPSGARELAHVLFAQGELALRTGKFDAAKTVLLEALAIADRTGGPNNENSAFILASVARVQDFAGDAAGAEATYRRAIAISRNLPKRFESRLGTALLNLGLTLARKRAFDEAIKTTQEGDAILSRQGDSYYSFEAKFYLCRVYFFQTDYVRAAEVGAKAYDIGKKFAPLSPDFRALKDFLGLSLVRSGKPKEGEVYLREYLATPLSQAAPTSEEVIMTKIWLGESLQAQGRWSEAESFYREGHELLKNRLGDKHALTQDALTKLTKVRERN